MKSLMHSDVSIVDDSSIDETTKAILSEKIIRLLEGKSVGRVRNKKVHRLLNDLAPKLKREIRHNLCLASIIQKETELTIDQIFEWVSFTHSIWKDISHKIDDVAQTLIEYKQSIYPLAVQQLGEHVWKFKDSSLFFDLWYFHQTGSILRKRDERKRKKLMIYYDDFSRIPFEKVVQYIPKYVLLNMDDFPHKWLLHLGTGRNIRKLEGYSFSKKMAHAFHNIPINEKKSGIIDSIIYCHVIALGGNTELYHLIRNSFYFSNWSYLSQIEELKPYIRKFIKWNIFNTLTVEERRLIMGYLSHIVRDEPGFSIKGRTFTSFMRLANAYHDRNTLQRNQLQINNNRNQKIPELWKGNNYQDWNVIIDKKNHQIKQLKNRHSLEYESYQLNHCVRGYAFRCYEEKCSIWSLQIQLNQQHWKSLVTIEVNTNKEIIQAKGNHNSIPKPEHLDMIKAWAKREGLKFVGC